MPSYGNKKTAFTLKEGIHYIRCIDRGVGVRGKALSVEQGCCFAENFIILLGNNHVVLKITMTK